jgi:DMSO/TMAO reductase YedYZ molybdopterin-dependent catalytic subunit
MNHKILGPLTAFPLTRREWLGHGVRLAGAVCAAEVFRPAWLGPFSALAQDAPAGSDRLIVRSARFIDLETPVNLLNSWITPNEFFFVRNHLALPNAAGPEWRLSISGEVEKPLFLSLAELRRMESATLTNTLECAGNGRAFYRPRAPGIQWQRGAVGNARFTGPRLAELLMRAGIKPTAKHVAFNGIDAPPGKVPDFIRSIPIEKAVDRDTLVALEMNGVPLPLEHGYPARAMVSGWIGSASVKWLSEIRVLDHEFEGNFMNPGYRLPDHPGKPGEPVDPKQTHAATGLRVKSTITSPGDGALWKRKAAQVTGVAWAGENQIDHVDVSTDEGKTWKPATLGADKAKYSWRLWSLDWIPPATGDFVILSRATDDKGNIQPETPDWNPSGYLWNGFGRARLRVKA